MSELYKQSHLARPWNPCSVPLNMLKVHEEVCWNHLRRLMEEIVRDGVLKRPLLVENRHLIILDGHHRYAVLKTLGASRAPIFPVEYDSPKVVVSSWRPEVRVTKEMVLEAGLKGKLLPFKTSRHILRGVVIPEVNVPLRELVGGGEG